MAEGFCFNYDFLLPQIHSCGGCERKLTSPPWRDFFCLFDPGMDQAGNDGNWKTNTKQTVHIELRIRQNTARGRRNVCVFCFLTETVPLGLIITTLESRWPHSSLLGGEVVSLPKNSWVWNAPKRFSLNLRTVGFILSEKLEACSQMHQTST